MPEAPAVARPPLALAAGVFLISACVLSLEVAFTRIFSAVLRYHFVFLVISMAVCGLGVGGMLVHVVRRLERLSMSAAASAAAIGFGLSAAAFLVILFRVLLPHRPEWYRLIAVLIMVPFVFAGGFLAVAFRAHPSWTGTLYAWDLLGAAAASMGVVAAMQLFGPVHSCLLVATGAVSLGIVQANRRAVCALAAVPVLVLWAGHAKFQWLDIPPLPTEDITYAKPLYVELATGIGSKIVHTEWDAFARTDVVDDPQVGESALLIYTNGHVPTNLVKYDRSRKQYAVDRNLAQLPFRWHKPQSVLCIGPGAGMDLLLAREVNAQRIDGVEVNPAIPRILRLPRFRAFGGDPYHLPGVNVVVGDGRTFVRASRRKYDMIFTALTKTATSSAGLALVEGYIYTVDAFKDYWDHLTPDGQLVLVTDGYPPNVRLFNTAVAHLQNAGVPLPGCLDHLALLAVNPQELAYGPYQFALIMSRRAFTRQETDSLFRMTYREGYQPLFVPHENEAAPFPVLRRPGATVSDLARAVSDGMPEPLNLMPVTDDAPFFLDLTYGVPWMLLQLLMGTAGVVMAFSFGVLIQGAGSKAGMVGSLYFACLGIGFMLIEIPLLQKLILVLGHPTYSLTVVLFALLLGGGLGSALSQRVGIGVLEKRMPAIGLLVAGMAVVTSWWFSTPHPGVLAAPLAVRIAWSGLISGAMGFVMGMPFPAGMRLLGRSRPSDIPWMWGVNGLTSVLGSLLAAIGAKQIGFSMVFLAGAGVYALGAILGWQLGRVTRSEASA